MSETIQDKWVQWLLNRRHGGDAEQKKVILGLLSAVRDQVLRNAKLAEGESLLDIGTGDGLIAFGALEQVGEQGKVIFSDVSQDCLDYCQSLAQEMGLLGRCQFVRASADDLAAFNDASVNVITVRSVLIYVEAKRRAFQEFHRVLKPAGRLSVLEPINRFCHPEPEHIFWGYNMTPLLDIARKVRAIYLRLQPETDPMLDFDERTLIALAEESGFAEIHLELRADILPTTPYRSWEAWLRSAPNPKVPTLEEALNQALTPDEAAQFTAYLRPLVETGQGTARSAMAFLWAVRH